MGLLKQLTTALTIFIIGYLGIIILALYGIKFSNYMFNPIGMIILFNLSLAYSYYFRL